MSEFKLTFSNEIQDRMRRCSIHRHAKENDFIEVEIKSTGKKVIRCRLCEWNKETARKARQLDWYNHKKVMTDYYIKRLMVARNPGLKMHEISNEVIETKRTVLQIKRMVEDLNKPLKVCNKHGNLFKDDVNKSEIRYGKQLYKCKKCQKEWREKNYQANKISINLKNQKYKKDNIEKVREWRRNWNKTKKGKNARLQKEFRYRQELKDWYVKKLIAKRNKLIGVSSVNVPKTLIELKRASQLLKREIRLKLTGEKDEKRNENQQHE